ncbi:MAG: glycosyltransferase, partial [Bacteroidota bacterium]
MVELEPNFYAELSTLDWVLLGVLVTTFLLQVIYMLVFHVRISLYKEKGLDGHQPPISIIICAKNEEKNLRELIPLLMEQDYPSFQVVVVNDNSWDGSFDTLRALEVSYPNLYCIHLDEEKQLMQGKKFALTLGIKGAKHEHLLLTDADCRPNGLHWLREMGKKWNNEKTIVLGFSPYDKTKGLLNKLIRYDALQAGMNY